MSWWDRLKRALDNPIVAQDGISRMRSWRAPVAITAYLGLLGGFGYAIFAVGVLTADSSHTVAAQIGAYVFIAMAFFQLALICLFVPALTAAAISGERERQTFDVLLVSRISAFGIVWGKLVGSLAYVLMLILTALPLYAAVFLFGGIDFEQFTLTQVITVMTALSIGATSVFLSALFKRTLPSTVSSYGAAFGLVVGTLVAGVFLSFVADFQNGQQASYEAHPVLFANPVYALDIVLTQPSGAALPIGRLLQLLVFSSGRPSHWGPSIEPWQLCILSQAVLTAISVFTAVLLVRGRRAVPLRRRHRPLEGMAS